MRNILGLLTLLFMAHRQFQGAARYWQSLLAHLVAHIFLDSSWRENHSLCRDIDIFIRLAFVSVVWGVKSDTKILFSFIEAFLGVERRKSHKIKKRDLRSFYKTKNSAFIFVFEICADTAPGIPPFLYQTLLFFRWLLF